MAKYRAIDAARKLADEQMKYQREAFAKLEPSPATKRIAELESRLRIWRDDYERSADGALVTIPVRQIIELIGERTTTE